jgi:hypothetical protein
MLDLLADFREVFTQFVTTALVIGRMLQMEGIPFLYLNGKVTSAEKLKAISGFKDKNSKIRYLVRFLHMIIAIEEADRRRVFRLPP